MRVPAVSDGVRYILIATFMFALMQVGVKWLSHIPSHEIVTFRAVISLVVCWALLRRAGISPWGNNRRWLIARGAAGTVALTLFFYTLQRMPLASAVTLQYLSPIFTVIIAGVMLNEPPRPIQWLFFAVSFAGVLLIKGFDPRVTPLDVGLGVVAASASGVAYNIIRKVRTDDHHLVVVFYFPLVTVPIIGTYTAFHWVMPSPVDWLVLLMIGICVTIAQIYMTRAYQAERAANISNFNYLGVVFALTFGLVIFGEHIEPLALAGIALIIIGTLLSSRYRRTE
ncbi:MAG: DMT family transporter [candidate division Zixibacteria bacterium]|jgi:drug/metabolite transporter (DMT)-like permease|nr:DMT family transporter [candidate division Zixibacteria bacterium]